MKKGVDFHALTRPTQDRFVDAVLGKDVPHVILSTPGGPKTQAPWIALSVVCAIAIFVLQRMGYGDLSSALSVQGVPLLVVYALLGTAVVLGIVQAAAQWAKTAALPYRAGIYLFPTCVIDARRHALEVFQLVDLTSPAQPDASNTFTLVFPDGHFVFRAENKEAAEEAARTIASAIDIGPESIRRVDNDPLHEPKYMSPLAAQDPFERYAPFWITGRYVLAVAIGAAIGFGIWQVRNVSSDDKMFAVANQRKDVESYKAYLAHGKRHAQEVSSTLLPRAELHIAESANTVEAIQDYIKKHPGSAIQTEVDAALRKAMLDELERAKKPGTLASLNDFAKKYPEHHLDTELKDASHAIYQAALQRVLATSASKTAIAFFSKLVTYAETKGTKVEIRFRRKPSATLARADKAVQQNPSFNGEISYTSRYFDAAHLLPRENALGKTLVDRLNNAFPSEIVTFGNGPLLEDATDNVPTVTVPTILVTHSVDWLGIAFVSRAPHGIFVGLTYNFDVILMLPGETTPIRFKHTSIRPVPLDVLNEYSKALPVGSSVEEKAYTAMNTEAFAELGTKLLAHLFNK